MKASEVLLKAAGLMSTRGHCKGAFEREPGGALCLAGAIQLAAHGDANRWAGATDEITDLVAEVIDREHYIAAIQWNNDATTTEGQVIAALDAAAVVALQEEGLEPEDVL
jgi:hypothetical protein